MKRANEHGRGRASAGLRAARGTGSWLGVLLMIGCGSGGAPTASTVSVPTQGASATGASASTGAAEPSATAAAGGWTAGAVLIEASTIAGRGDFFRHLTFDRAAGTLAVDDSDPYPTKGPELKQPRVIKRTLELAPAERARVEAALDRVRPDAAALAARCAPGGCLRLERRMPDGTSASLEHGDTVARVLRELGQLFPEIRQD